MKQSAESEAGSSAESVVASPSGVQTGLVACGREACLRLLDAAFGPVVRHRESEWLLALDYRRVGCEKVTRLANGIEPAAAYLADLHDPFSQLDPWSVGVHCMPRRERTYMASWETNCYDHAVMGIPVRIWLPGLFQAGAPLHDPRVLQPDGHVAPGHLTDEDWRAARRCGRVLLERFAYRPTYVLASQTALTAFWRLEHAALCTPENRAVVEQVQRQIRCLLPAGQDIVLSGTLPVPVFDHSTKTPRPIAELLWAEPGRRYDLRALRDGTQDASGAVTHPSRARGKSQERPPIMLDLRTLPEGWALEDLDLPPACRRLAHPDVVMLERLRRGVLRDLISALAAARYGYRDLELILHDRRYAYSSLAPFAAYTPLGRRRTYTQALARASDRVPPRLPYGIRRIVPLGGDPAQPRGRRFLVEGGSRRYPFSFDVTFETLLSPRAFRTQLGKQLGILPYAVSRRVWEGMLRAGLQDPRLRRPGASGGQSPPRPLSGWIEDYAALAPDEERADQLGEEGGPGLWPRHKDGLVLFPLKHLRAWLEERIPGEAPRQSEVTAAVRYLGGDCYGSVRLGPQDTVRCWYLPYPGRRAGARARREGTRSVTGKESVTAQNLGRGRRRRGKR